MTAHSKSVGGNWARSGVTVTFGYPELRTLVAPNLRAALAQAERRWGHWLTVESISTPDTIYRDVTGRTLASAQPGTKRSGNPTTRGKLEAAGYRPGPDEIGYRRYSRRPGD